MICVLQKNVENETWLKSLKKIKTKFLSGTYLAWSISKKKNMGNLGVTESTYNSTSKKSVKSKEFFQKFEKNSPL